HSLTMKTSFKKLSKKEKGFSEKGKAEINTLIDAASKICEQSIICFYNADKTAADKIFVLYENIEKLCRDTIKKHKKRLKNGKCSVDMGFILSDLTADIKSIADHCKNIGEAVVRNI
ncbi:MAG: hypothetical protein IJ736_15350, partial [Firmicutes bacterium]|nr:hypothetical protein [Bacillota bacterium]